jgi:spermidine synthase
VIEILIGVFSAASLPILFSIVKSDAIQAFVRDMSSQFGLLIVSDSIVALVLMLIPATLIGATLPLAGRIVVADLRYTGTMVGRVYAVNTLGNVLGALLPGLLILPLVGIQKGVLLMAALNICLGLLLLAAQWKKHACPLTSSSPQSRRRRTMLYSFMKKVAWQPQRSGPRPTRGIS